MSSWPSRLFYSTNSMAQLNIFPTNGPRLVRQNAFIIDPDDPHDPFEPNSISPSDESSISSLSSLTSPSNSFLVENDDTIDSTQQQKPFARIPLAQNTADNDRPEPIPTTQIQSDKVLLLLCSIFLVVILSIWSYQAISCINIKHLSTERLSVDPDGPSYVYIPVFQWTCWRQTWIGMYYASALWITGIAIAFYWMHLKRR